MAEPVTHIFTTEYYERLAQFERFHPWSAHMQRLTLALLDRYSGGRGMDKVLDAGCGAGYFTEIWRERGRIPVVAGLDSFFEGLRLAHSRGLKHLTAASVSALPYGEGAFDAIHCGDVLQHLSPEQAAAAIAEFARVLRTGGLLVIRAAARRGLGAKKHADTDDYQQWEPEKLKSALGSDAFEIRWISLVNWLPSLISDLGAYGKPAPSGDVGLPPRSSAQPAGLRRSLMIAYWKLEELILLRLGWRLPGGHTLMCVARRR